MDSESNDIRFERATLASMFLGPQAENADFFERLILYVLRDYVFWRRNFQPEDPFVIREIDKIDEVACSAPARLLVGRGEIHALRLHEHPVNAGDADVCARRGFANTRPLCRGNVRDGFRDRERRDLGHVVAGFFRERECVIERPALENLVADAEFHLEENAAERRQVESEKLDAIPVAPRGGLSSVNA